MDVLTFARSSISSFLGRRFTSSCPIVLFSRYYFLFKRGGRRLRRRQPVHEDRELTRVLFRCQAATSRSAVQQAVL